MAQGCRNRSRKGGGAGGCRPRPRGRAGLHSAPARKAFRRQRRASKRVSCARTALRDATSAFRIAARGAIRSRARRWSRWRGPTPLRVCLSRSRALARPSPGRAWARGAASGGPPASSRAAISPSDGRAKAGQFVAVTNRRRVSGFVPFAHPHMRGAPGYRRACAPSRSIARARTARFMAVGRGTPSARQDQVSKAGPAAGAWPRCSAARAGRGGEPGGADLHPRHGVVDVHVGGHCRPVCHRRQAGEGIIAPTSRRAQWRRSMLRPACPWARERWLYHNSCRIRPRRWPRTGSAWSAVEAARRRHMAAGEGQVGRPRRVQVQDQRSGLIPPSGRQRVDRLIVLLRHGPWPAPAR